MSFLRPLIDSKIAAGVDVRLKGWTSSYENRWIIVVAGMNEGQK